MHKESMHGAVHTTSRLENRTEQTRIYPITIRLLILYGADYFKDRDIRSRSEGRIGR